MTQTEEEIAAAAAAAEAEAAEKAAAAKPRRKGKGAEIDTSLLRHLADQVAAHEAVSAPVFNSFVHELEADHGAEIDDEEPVVTIRMAGIEAQGAAGIRAAVVNWGMAARRALLGQD